MKHITCMRIGRSRKGMLLLTLTMLGVIIGFIVFLVTSAGEETGREQRFIGENALAILRADQKAQLVLTYLDMVALFATREGLLLLAERGGIAEDTPCGTYAGYSVWQMLTEDGRIERCAPESIDEELSLLVSRLIDTYAQNIRVLDQTSYETYQLPINNYRIGLRERDGLLDVIGSARDDLYFRVRRDRVVAYTPQREQPSRPIPTAAERAGSGTEEAGENVIVGDYTIDPAFRVRVDYDLDDYTALREAVFGDAGLVARMEACERRGEAIDACMRASLNDLDRDGTVLDDARMMIVGGPCETEENIKSDLVEGYLDCAASDGSACICSVQLGQSQQNGRPSPQSSIQIILTKDQPAQSSRDVDSLIDAIPTHAVHGLARAARFLAPDEIQIDIPPEGREIKLYKEQDMLYYVQDTSASSHPACTMNKRTFKFCAQKVDPDSFALWRLVDGVPIKQGPRYKFALTFPEVTLPEAGS